MIKYSEVLEQLKFLIESGNVSIFDRISLIERLVAYDKQAVYFLYYFLDLSGEKPPVTYDENEHITRSIKKMMDLIDLIDEGAVVLYDQGDLHNDLISESDLIEDDKRAQILATVYFLMKQHSIRHALALLEVFEKITDGGVNFKHIPILDGILYRKMYIVVFCRFFDHTPDSTKEFILQNTFFLGALQMRFDISLLIKKYVHSYVSLSVRKRLSLNFASDIAINKTKIGKMLGGVEVTVEDWIKMLREGIEKKEVENRESLVEILDKNPNILANLEYNQVVIKQIILLYYDLVAGNFILEDDGFEPVEKIMQEMAKEQGIDLEADQKEHTLSFDTQLDLHTTDFDTWILENDTQGSLFTWLEDYSTSDAKHKALVNLFITKHISLESEENISALLELTDYLKQNGFDQDHDLIYFNSQTNQFEWNK